MSAATQGTETVGPIPIVAVTRAEFDPWLKEQSAPVRTWIGANQFEGKAGQHVLLAGSDGAIEAVVCGVGDRREVFSIAHLVTHLSAGRYRLEADWDDPNTSLMALGFRLGAYRFDRYLRNEHRGAKLVLPEGRAQEVKALTKAVALVRDLVNTPAEDLGPQQLGEALAAVASEHGGEFGEVVGDELLARGYPAIHAVGRAATVTSRLLSQSWGRPRDPLVALVGKGVCFDSGGLDLKSAAGMRLMKKDMGGAAHAIGLAQLVMQRRLPVRLLVLIPAVENAVAGNAYRPGDIIATRKGLSVEIGNTDAEGRVVLADALTRASEENPELVIDFATLTGAARIALGPDLPALFANCDKVAEALLTAGIRVEDPLWRMPLHQPYRDLLDSPVADVSNVASINFGGCITAALFLEKFVGEGLNWCHIDTYAWNRSARPGRPAGGEAQGMRSVFEYLRERFG